MEHVSKRPPQDHIVNPSSQNGGLGCFKRQRPSTAKPPGSPRFGDRSASFGHNSNNSSSNKNNHTGNTEEQTVAEEHVPNDNKDDDDDDINGRNETVVDDDEEEDPVDDEEAEEVARAVREDRLVNTRAAAEKLESILDSVKHTTQKLLSEIDVYLKSTESVILDYAKCQKSQSQNARRLEDVETDVVQATGQYGNA